MPNATSTPDMNRQTCAQDRNQCFAGEETPCPERPDLSIVVVSWNARAYLEKCLASIEQTSHGLTHEVVVVDNASSDGSPEAVRQGNFKCVRLIETGANLGFAKANNVGIRQSNGRLLALINSDVVVKPGCLQRLVAFMDRRPDVGLAGPRLLNADGSPQASCRRQPRLASHFARAVFINTSLADPAYRGSSTAEVEVLAGSFWIARRKAVDEVGLLDESFFFYGEDIDWCQRFRAAGWKVAFYPEAESIHYGGASSGADPFRFHAELQRATVQLWEKYHGRSSTALYLLIGLLYHFLRAAACVARLCFFPADGWEIKQKLKQHWYSMQWLLRLQGGRRAPRSGGLASTNQRDEGFPSASAGRFGKKTGQRASERRVRG